MVLGSTRPGRNGKAVADWVVEQAAGRDATYELVDLADFELPLLDEPYPAARGNYQNDHTKKWSETIAQYDAYVFVTPEYNHSTSGALKNALDYLFAEWNDKVAGFVGYGSLSGARSIEHLRGIVSELRMAHIRETLNFSLMTDFENFSEFKPADRHIKAADEFFTELERWSGAFQTLRG